MTHKKEYEKSGTVSGWKIEEIESGVAPEGIQLIFWWNWCLCFG